jgi:hypothetical protein
MGFGLGRGEHVGNSVFRDLEMADKWKPSPVSVLSLPIVIKEIRIPRVLLKSTRVNCLDAPLHAIDTDFIRA